MLAAIIILHYASLTGTVGILDDVSCNENKKPIKHCVAIVRDATKPSTVLVIIYSECIEYDIR